FNFTRSAQERNAEDLVLIRSSVVATQYLRNWNAHAAHSQLVRTEASRSPRQQVTRADTEDQDVGSQVSRSTDGSRHTLSDSVRVPGSLETIGRKDRIAGAGAQTWAAVDVAGKDWRTGPAYATPGFFNESPRAPSAASYYFGPCPRSIRAARSISFGLNLEADNRCGSGSGW